MKMPKEKMLQNEIMPLNFMSAQIDLCEIIWFFSIKININYMFHLLYESPILCSVYYVVENNIEIV